MGLIPSKSPRIGPRSTLMEVMEVLDIKAKAVLVISAETPEVRPAVPSNRRCGPVDGAVGHTQPCDGDAADDSVWFWSMVISSALSGVRRELVLDEVGAKRLTL